MQTLYLTVEPDAFHAQEENYRYFDVEWLQESDGEYCTAIEVSDEDYHAYTVDEQYGVIELLWKYVGYS